MELGLLHFERSNALRGAGAATRTRLRRRPWDNASAALRLTERRLFMVMIAARRLPETWHISGEA